MAGITHLIEFQKPAMRALVDLTNEQVESTFADRFLPTVTTRSRTFAYDIIQTNTYIAAYIGFGAEPPYIGRDVLAGRMGTLAFFALGDLISYEELQAIHEARNEDERVDAIESLTLKNIKILDGLRRLIYVAKMETLFKGTHTFSKGDGEKNQITFEFGIPAGNKVALLPGADFDEPGFDVIGFFQTQVAAYKAANNGKSPETAVTSDEVINKILRNSNMVVEAGRPEGSTRISVDEMNQVFRSYRLPVLEVIEEREVQYRQNGSGALITKVLVPANRITFLSQGIGEYRLGPTLENDFKPGLYIEAEDLRHPIRSIIHGYGAGFPTPEVPSLIMHLDVFTPE